MALPLLGAFLSASVGALAKKALIAVGLGTITYAGLQAAFDGAQAQVISHYGQMPAVAMLIADLAGVGQTIGILLGAMAARVGMAALSHISKVL